MSTGYERLASRAYTLLVREGPDAGKQISISNRVIRLGTNPECEFELNDPTASRIHARIEIDAFGHRLMDERSKNGTSLNGIRIRDAYLVPGASIVIGDNVIEYRPDSKPVEFHLANSNQFGKMLGISTGMREIFGVLERVSGSDITILVEGESGTGKELVADAIHAHSKRNAKPFVVFDCSAVAATLIESELFGHVKGAFTGASTDRAGAFERARGGTLFLDEIGELPLDLQPKLLRVLEQRSVQPVGSARSIACDVRIVAATNRNLQKEVELSQFRQDLFYRLAVIRIVLPPLRRRIEDIPLLVQHFLDENNSSEGLHIQVGYETILKLQNHRWPGNIRELKNFVERAALLATDERLETKHLAVPGFGDTRTESAASNSPLSLAIEALDPALPFKDAKSRLIDQFERAYWTRLLERTNGNVSAAARTAGIHRKSAEYLLKKLDLKAEDSHSTE
jgi:transcriptional regulator with GAF, ATPase, and Fis domain